MRNGIPTPPSTIGELRILPGVRDAINKINNHGYVPVVISNQPDIARGTLDIALLDEIHSILQSQLGIKHFYVCPHDDFDNCGCRKPKDGLIRSAVEDLKIDVSGSFLVGDRWRDIQAGFNAGLKSYFIDYSYPESMPNVPHIQVSSLYEAVELEIGASNEL